MSRNLMARVLWKILPLALGLWEITRVLILSRLLPKPVSLGFAMYLLVDSLKRRMCKWYLWLTIYLGFGWMLPGFMSGVIGMFLVIQAWDSWDHGRK